MPAAMVWRRLAAHIDLARRVLADQHDREAGLRPARRHQCCNVQRHGLRELGGELLSIDHDRVDGLFGGH